MITLTSFCLVPFSHAVQRARPSTGPNRGRGGPELGQTVGEIIPGVCDVPSSGRIFEYFLSGSIVGESVAVHSLTLLCQVMLV